MANDFLLAFSSNRRLDNKLNVFEGLCRNWLFFLLEYPLLDPFMTSRDATPHAPIPKIHLQRDKRAGVKSRSCYIESIKSSTPTIHCNIFAISLIMIGGQILIVFIGGKALSVTRLTLAQWAYSVVLGVCGIIRLTDFPGQCTTLVNARLSTPKIHQKRHFQAFISQQQACLP
jgi:hypothetical protein